MLSNLSPRDEWKVLLPVANQVGCTFQELNLKVANGKLPVFRQ